MNAISRFGRSWDAYGLHGSELWLGLAGEEFPNYPNIPRFDSQQQREAAILDREENDREYLSS